MKTGSRWKPFSRVLVIVTHIICRRSDAFTDYALLESGSFFKYADVAHFIGRVNYGCGSCHNDLRDQKEEQAVSLAFAETTAYCIAHYKPISQHHWNMFLLWSSSPCDPIQDAMQCCTAIINHCQHLNDHHHKIN